MREVDASQVTQAVRDLCIQANCALPPDVPCALRQARDAEDGPAARAALDAILDNVRVAAEDDAPLCQDTGMACVLVEIGQDVHVRGDLRAAVDEGVRQGYTDGCLRKSMVADPLRRVNTNDNTPAFVTFDVRPGDALRIVVAPKGGGSENMGAVRMLVPAQGRQGVVDFVVDTVRKAGPNPCPPVVVGVAVGGNLDAAPTLARRALMRELGSHNPDPYYAQLEDELLERINQLGIGAQGFGGATTALAVNVEAMPTHIACLPVAVCLNCHVARHAEAVL
ncbi:MAG: fumarate hydratase [Atopobiaceae bacterium]|jgi:fumarate hydratase subunit alpha|nr:fumarate hydratase [Atopobiaceae bacterium]MCH4119408.1 fumarate hydratase [Atopobiaceae bacterium]MCI1318126.1 fumarate hydratase [Atopobiaceae bacterium]MCI1388995.1 fumarate hydratase [Atopobiaceae bacterium]MCI1431771.1 fumarate hydratase [Atopobiaceae bacterium]